MKNMVLLIYNIDYRKEEIILTLNKMIDILKKYQELGLGDLPIFIDENLEIDNIDDINILFNGEYNTIDIQFCQ